MLFRAWSLVNLVQGKRLTLADSSKQGQKLYSKSLAKASEYQLEGNKFCYAHCLHVKDETVHFLSYQFQKKQ